MQIIATIQQKGGVGKTTSVANLAGSLGKMGHKTLLVDLDPQANLTTSFGIESEKGPGIADLFAAQINKQPLDATKLVLPASENVDIFRGSMRMSQVEAHMSRTPGSYQFLQNILNGVDAQYDVCLIDCAPSLSPLAVSALSAADWVLVPMQPEYLPLSGLNQLTQTIMEARTVNKKLKLLGVLLTFVPRPATKVTREVLETIVTNKVPLLKARIPRTVRLVEGAKHGVPLVITQPKNPAALAYQELADEIAERLNLSAAGASS